MKTTSPMQRVDEPAGATAGCPPRGVVRGTLTGFGGGVVSAAAYLLLGVQHFPAIPRWADVVFYPGFFVSYTVYDLGLSQNFFKAVGVFAVGLAYAAVAAPARFAWFALQLRRQSAGLRQHSE